MLAINIKCFKQGPGPLKGFKAGLNETPARRGKMAPWLTHYDEVKENKGYADNIDFGSKTINSNGGSAVCSVIIGRL